MRNLIFVTLMTATLSLQADDLWNKTIANVSAAPQWRPSTIVLRAEMVGEDGLNGNQESTYDVRRQASGFVAVEVAHHENGEETPVTSATPVPLETMMPREPLFENSAQGDVTVERLSQNDRIATYRFRYKGNSGTVTVDTQRALPLSVAYAASGQAIKSFSTAPASVEVKYAVDAAGTWHPISVTTRSLEAADRDRPRRTLVISMSFARR